MFSLSSSRAQQIFEKGDAVFVGLGRDGNYTLAYTSKGCTPVEVLPVPNAYTTCEPQLVFLLSIQVIFSMFCFRMWCTHQGPEVPQPVYTLLTCNPVYRLSTCLVGRFKNLTFWRIISLHCQFPISNKFKTIYINILCCYVFAFGHKRSLIGSSPQKLQDILLKNFLKMFVGLVYCVLYFKINVEENQDV